MKPKQSILFALILSLLLSGCFGVMKGAKKRGPRLETSTDEITNNKIFQTTGNKVDGGPADGGYYFEFVEITKPNGERQYAVLVVLHIFEWVHIEKGDIIEINIDGEIIRLTTENGSIGNRHALDACREKFEKAYYYTDLAIMKRISNAKSVKFRIQGSMSTAIGSLSRQLRPLRNERIRGKEITIYNNHFSILKVFMKHLESEWMSPVASEQ